MNRGTRLTVGACAAALLGACGGLAQDQRPGRGDDPAVDSGGEASSSGGGPLSEAPSVPAPPASAGGTTFAATGGTAPVELPQPPGEDCTSWVGNEEWSGFHWTASSADSTVSDEFLACDICAHGVLSPAVGEWAGLGWNLNQAYDPVTFEPLEALPVATEGWGLDVSLTSAGPTEYRLVLNEGPGGRTWCTSVPPGLFGEVSWGSFNTDCVTYGGEAYEVGTPITSIMIQAVALDDTESTLFDFCRIQLGQIP